MAERLKNWIKMHRARLDMRQEDLAAKVGCTRQTIISIEKYRYTPSVELALRIAKALGIKVDELFYFAEGEDEE